MRTVKGISARETLDILNKPYATSKDISKLAMVGIDRARAIKKEIAKNLAEQGYRLPSSGVPMDIVVGYLNINIKYLEKISKLEK